MYLKDRDLLVYEPSLFIDTMITPQILVKDTPCSFSNNNIYTQAVDFSARNIGIGSVVTLGLVPLEIIEVVDDHRIRLSFLRSRIEDDPIEVRYDLDTKFSVITYEPQIALAHEELRCLLQIKSEDFDNLMISTDTENIIKFKRIIAYIALEKIFQNLLLSQTERYKTLYEKCLYYQQQVLKALDIIHTTNRSDGLPVMSGSTAQLTRT
ncbi:hypothetical protein KS4_35990 [Poriferisphaera corsica]|uniref:Uncharacterized protein n=1 Tax=Poriferisphaera corsica TaxID=2528020 RepID=A0A517YZ66_9BACT|nr:hypothetical protein [Poriferisphaera corsica]QDU35516.1 hypothetical protein KS4_35990 [Poriferisphaera corsica]